MSHQEHNLPTSVPPIGAMLDQLDALVTTSTVGHTPLLLGDHLRQELIMLVGTSAGAEIEQLLIHALHHPHCGTRIAALDIINQLGWQSGEIIRALLATWHDYASPSAALLMTLDTCWQHNAACFPIDALPMRQILTHNPVLLSMIMEHNEWQSLLRLLYIPVDATFDATQINRDSPLTQLLIDTFTRSPGEGRERLIVDLLRCASECGSAMGRDAALALSVLGNTEWLTYAWVGNLHDRSNHFQSFLALFVLMWSSLIMHTLDINLDHAHDLAIIRAPHVAAAILNPRDQGLERVRMRLLHLVLSQVPLLDRHMSAICDLAETLQSVRNLDYDFERAQEIAYMVEDLHLRYPHNVSMQHAHRAIQAMCATLETAITFSFIWDSIREQLIVWESADASGSAL